MAEKKAVLITGVAGYWGTRVAKRLLEETAFRVIGLDVEPPEQEIKGLDFIQADVRNPLLLELFQLEEIDTLCHTSFVPSTRPSEAIFDLNVMGAMKILGVCAQVGVRKIVLKSSTAVYGAHPSNSAFLTEDHPLRGSRRYGYTKDMVEIESFCNGFRRQAPDIHLTVLRFASIVGPTADTPMTRLLKGPRAPVLLGFDPMMQVIHEDDVVESLVYAIVNDVPGVFNVAAEGVLPLLKMMALSATLPVPVFHLLAYWGLDLFGGTGLRLSRYAPIDLDYIRYPWVADLGKMRREFGFIPGYTAEEAVREFAGQQRLSHYLPESATLVYDKDRLSDTIERRRRARERQKANDPAGDRVEQEEKDSE